MTLEPYECEQFYRIWWSLLNYVNNEKQLISDFSTFSIHKTESTIENKHDEVITKWQL